MLRTLRLSLILALGGFAIIAARELPPADPLAEAEEALKDRDYAKAVELFKKAFGEAKEGRDQILYLQATAHQGAGQFAEGIAVCDRLIKEFPASPWVFKAHFKKGDLLALQKEHEIAAKLTEERLKAATAPERRRGIAMIYVSAGREFLEPKEKGDPTFVPNYIAAQRLLIRAVELDALGADEEAVRLDVLTCEWKGNFDRNLVLKTIKEFRAKFPKSTRMDEVALTEGRALAALGRRWDAKKAWEAVPATSKHAGPALYETALLYDARVLREFARFRDLLRRLLDKHSDAEIAPQAAMLLADATSAFGDLRPEAIDAYGVVVAKFPKDERAPTALIRIAELRAAGEQFDEAVATYEIFLKNYTENARWTEVRQRIADVRYLRSWRAFARKDYAQARRLWDEFLATYPTDVRGAAIGILRGDALREEKKWAEAVEQYRRTAQRYAGWNEAPVCRLKAGEILETEIGDFDGAIKEYTKAGAGDRIAALRNKSHSIASEKIFTTAEAASVLLTCRNVQKLQFRLWALDLKDYFEKKASVANLHAIEVGLIAPDQEWEVEVKDYAKHKQFKVAVPVPAKAAGAYIVTAREENRESTTVVVVSDLAFIAKAGRHGVTLFGQDNRKNQPLDTIPFRVAADGKIMKDGKAFPKDVCPGRVSILADVLGNFAFRDIDLSAIARRPDRKAAALIVPDRSIYAEGETVHLRIFVRDVVDNAFVVPKDKTYKLVVVSTHGVTLVERELKLSATGTALEKFDLPKGVVGARIDVTEGRTLVGQVGIGIGPVRPKTLRIDFENEDRTFFVGDSFDVRINLRAPGGRPLRAKKFKYHLAGAAEWKDATTDENGGFTIRIDETEAYARSGAVELEVTADGARDLHVIPLLPKGFFIEIDPTSRVFEPVLAGEPKTIVILTRDFARKPVSRRIAWEVRRADAAGERVLVAHGETTTDNKEGKGTFAFQGAEGGVHEVVLRARDDENLPVGASTAVLVSDAKDETKLRILSAKDEFAAGEPLVIVIHSRLDRGLAYVTVEDEQVQIVKSVTLEKGKNTVTLDLAGKSVRFARVSAMMVQASKFHHAVRDFRINRAPEPTIELDKKDYKPGDEVKLTVKTDKPSEVYVVVAEHVFAHLGEIDPVLAGPFFATDASNASGFEGQTSQVSRELEEALARLENLEKDRGVRVMMDTPDAQEYARKLEEKKPAADKKYDPGTGGGGGGRYGSRQGGKNIVPQNHAQPRPLVVAAIASGGTISFRLPHENAQYTIAVFANDGSTAIGRKSQELKVRADVTVEIECMGAVRAGDKASAVAYHASHVAPWTVKEVVVPFTADDDTTVKIEGREYRVRALPTSRERVVRGGGTSLTLDPGADASGMRLRVDVASSTEDQFALLEEPTTDFSPGTDLAVVLLARAARYRYLQEIKATADVAPVKSALANYLSLRATGGDIPTEVLGYLAVAEARLAGIDIKPSADAIRALFAQTPYDEQKALLLFALARTGDANFAYVNRLYRSSDTLSPRAAAIVAVLLHAAGKKDEAKALLAKIAKWDPGELPYIDGSNSKATTVAFVALAYAEIDPTNDQAAKSFDWLIANPAWSAFERGIVALVLERTFVNRKTPNTAAAVVLKVNGKEAKPGAIDPALLVKGAQKIEVSGGTAVGTLRYGAKEREEAFKITAKRTVGWPALEADGQTLALGLSVSTDDKTQNASMKKTSTGAVFTATIEYTFGPSAPRHYIIEEAVPAGCRCLSVTGLPARIEDGRVRLLLSKSNPGEVKLTVVLTLAASVPGTYAPAPSAVYALGDPNPVAHFAGGDALEIADKDARDGYVLTHGELYQLGRIAYDKKDWKKAKEHLTKLIEQATLHHHYYVEVARMLTYASLELGESDATVRYFEILKEKLPAEVVPFEKIIAIGRAYMAIREFERARAVFIGTLDAYFLQEANVVGALLGLGRTKPAADTMMTLLLAHPDSDLNRQMLFGLGQDLFQSGKASTAVDKDPLKLTRREMLTRAAEALERYLALHPADPSCDQVSLVLGSAYLEATEHERAEKSGRASAKRYPKSRYLDSFDYILAYSLFAQKKFADALEMCARLETFDYGAHSNPGPAIMKELATLMKAQIFHANGEIDKALDAYKAVRGKYPDAARAISFLEREAISMPEVTVVPAARPSEIEIEYSGVAEVSVKAYKVNLTMLFLKYKGVADASKIEVAGIRPAFEKTYALEKPNAKRREKQKIALDLKDTAAYLVTVKAGDFFSTGLFLKSDVTMTVQEEASSGTVRVNVANATSGRFEENVKVTFVGSADTAFKSEKTDLRGIAEAAGLKGFAMVIAEKDGHYAFHRGSISLSGHVPQQEQRKGQVDMNKNAQDALDEDLKQMDENLRRYRGNNDNRQQGVEVERTKEKK